jgi:hypothetical protein
MKDVKERIGKHRNFINKVVRMSHRKNVEILKEYNSTSNC